MNDGERRIVLLRDLYPIGLSQDPDFRISKAVRDRFERWRTSGKSVWESEIAARLSIPGAFAHGGSEFCVFTVWHNIFKKIIISRSPATKCLTSFKRFYPLADGRLVVKAVAWLFYPGPTEFPLSGHYPERLYYFAEMTDFPFLWRRL